MSCAAPHALHWQSVRETPAERIARQPGVSALGAGAERDAWEACFLERRYRVDPEAMTVIEVAPTPGRIPAPDFQILLIRYLLSPGFGPICGEPMSEKDLPGGVTFFRGPHALQVGPILERYGEDPAGFLARGQALGGEPTAEADAAVRLLPFPDIPVTFLLWERDEEFPASLSVLFDRSISRWFELDMIFLLVGVLARRFARPSQGLVGDLG